MTLRQQNSLLIITIIFALLTISLAGLFALDKSGKADNKTRITQLFKSTYSTIIQLEKMAESGMVAESKAKEIATKILQQNKYIETEYVYVADRELIFIAAPHDPDLHGTSFHDFKDAQGNSVGSLIQQVLSQNNNGITEYHWNSRRDNKVVDLTSIVQQTPRWGWVVGTGISHAESEQRFWKQAGFQAMLSIAILLVITAFLILFRRRLMAILGGEPTEVLALVQSVSSGKLNTHVNDCGPEGSIYHSTANMQNSLRELICEIKHSVTVLNDNLTSAESSSQTLYTNVSEQQRETEIIAQEILLLTQSAEQVTLNANGAAEKSNSANQVSKSVKQTISETSVSLSKLEKDVMTSGERINELADNVAKIDSIMQVINSISDQTNLLALNAAIEAARAGEHGRGFSVVADEVRQLSQRTQDSSSEITRMLEVIEQNTRGVVDTAKTNVADCEATKQKSDESVAGLEEVAKLIESTTLSANEIALEANSQGTVSEQLREQVNSISQHTEQLVIISDENKETVNAIRDMSTQLTVKLERFSI
ncbi:methyl-accepting chemotaxis protein [Psychrobium sp. 1_MG-2023]|uniref:methyl-accepting chemotaxis protein n=1 Tax=Psychrobium sp. 1_MG-2023 TaxID=3062624 RepID=UPI0026D9DB05|nr:methyl-accepting chemotaxis protein [Psychrobium sp. 1_MG-2023]MDP2561309.1 methyl-accepting chemotaxis protein [Psychrobium sp. 1_MG-2023]